MGDFIVKLADHYLIWSSIVDAPVTYGMTIGELTAYTRDEYGADGMRNLPKRLARVEAKGTSAFNSDSADDVMWPNRAGPGEIPLSKPEIIEWYVRRKRRPTAKEIAAHRATLPKCDPCVADDGHGGGMRCRCWGTGVVEDVKGGAR